jgi:hypothetical protein
MIGAPPESSLASRNDRRGSALGRAALALPIVFAVPVFLGIATSLVNLVGASHPAGSWSNVTNASSSAVFVGSDLYQDPARGFSGGVFPPLLAIAGGVLDHITVWSGWVILITILASVAMAARLGVLAYTPQGTARLDRLAAVAGAVGVAGLTWWLSSSLTTNFLLDGRVDQPAWILAILGLMLVPAAASGSDRAWVGALVVITAGVWTKQTSLTAIGAAGVWLPAACLLGVARWRRAATLMLALIALNAAILVIGNAATGGWLRYFLVDVSKNQAITATRGAALEEFLRRMVLPGAIVAVIAVTAAAVGLCGWRRVGARRGARRLLAEARQGDGAGRDLALATLLLIFIGIAAAGAVYARRKQGTTDNQYIGVVWGLGVLAVLAYRHAATRRVGAVAFALLSILLIWLTQADGTKQRLFARHGVYVPELERVAQWGEVDPAIRSFVATHNVYWWVSPDINLWAGVRQDPSRRRRMYPSYFDAVDVLAAGGQPLYLVRGLLDRRFDAVTLLPNDAGYASAYGTWEENYIWKLNKVIEARYAPSPRLPADFLLRRPGPERARWMRTCFGPFRFAGGSLSIGRGGGLWCRLDPRSARITLRETPAPASELRPREPVGQMAGALAVEVPANGGTFDVHVRRRDGTDVAVHGERQGRRVVVTQFDAGRDLGHVTLRRARRQAVRIVLAPGPPAPPATSSAAGGRDAVVHLGAVRGGLLNLAASQGSGVTFDVAALDLDAHS